MGEYREDSKKQNDSTGTRNRNRQKDSDDFEKKTGMNNFDKRSEELVQEPSGAALYARNAEEERRRRQPGERDPRIPAGGGHTEEEYFALPDDLRVELIDGVFYAMATPSRLHQVVAFEIAKQIDGCIEDHQSPCFMYIAPSDVALGEEKKTIVQPDVYVHCDRDKDKDKGTDPVRGAPDLVVEVLSPSNPENDLWRKRELYRRHGIREYWIVDSREQEIFVFDFDGTEGKSSEDPAPEKYAFDDVVPVRISEGTCQVDFRKIVKKILRLPEQERGSFL